jgi:hypothetical protein
MMDLIAYSDGTRSLLEIADVIDVPVSELVPIHRKLCEHGLSSNVEGAHAVVL